MSIILIGYRGCGKSTIGRKLADRLWRKFVDTDDLIVKKAGKSIKDIFAQDGEEKFRDLEEQVIAEITLLKDHVIALGGGAVLRQSNRDALQGHGHKVIYLKCDPKVLHDRIHADPKTAATRPNLTQLGGGIEEIQKLLEAREPLYRQIKTAELDVTRITPDQALIYIARLV
jgi:shikimate kinase